MNKEIAKGRVVKAFGNLLHVKFDGNIRQGEVAFIELDDLKIPAEVIEIKGDEAKMQVFEDTRGIQLNTPVSFSSHLLEAELGPGLISAVYDGLQNPLEKIAEKTGLFLGRGIYLPSLDRKQSWTFTPTAKVGDELIRGDEIGTVPEKQFSHKIMLPFAFSGKYEIVWIAETGNYTIEETIAKVKDEKGNIKEVQMLQKWPVKTPLRQGRKVTPEEMMDTGLRIIDTQFPLMKGGTFCSPGPFGAGKTVLQHHLAKHSSVDIVIVAACGERAGEVVEVLQEFPKLIDEQTKLPLINRTVIICNTSSMPVAAREASVYMAVTIAEYYRQMGLNILVLADSTSRWAQAMREMSGRLEEIPGEEAFPAYLASRIAAFYERAGVIQLNEGKGSVTIGGTVSPAGGNFEEPVTQATLSVVGAFLGLSRERSDARRYPAIDPLISWSKYTKRVAKIMSEKVDHWEEKVKTAEWHIRQSDEIGKRMEVIGEEGTAIADFMIYLKGELFDYCYLQQNAFDKEDAYCSMDRQLELFVLMTKIFEMKFDFQMHEQAREFMLQLQNEIKNLNFLPFQSAEYQAKLSAIYKILESKEQGGEK
ncbi:MAG TPA: V-type ATP synthase subunit A [Chlamydiales bacterium]|nr:V-type ATP synthase subunit A [Chlamydiales bacterium]